MVRFVCCMCLCMCLVNLCLCLLTVMYDVFVGVCSVLNMCVVCDWLCDVVWFVSL